MPQLIRITYSRPGGKDTSVTYYNVSQLLSACFGTDSLNGQRTGTLQFAGLRESIAIVGTEAETVESQLESLLGN